VQAATSYSTLRRQVRPQVDADLRSLAGHDNCFSSELSQISINFDNFVTERWQRDMVCSLKFLIPLIQTRSHVVCRLKKVDILRHAYLSWYKIARQMMHFVVFLIFIIYVSL